MSNPFPGPGCDRCQDTGECVVFFRSDMEPEYGFCACPTGQMLELKHFEQVDAEWRLWMADNFGQAGSVPTTGTASTLDPGLPSPLETR